MIKLQRRHQRLNPSPNHHTTQPGVARGIADLACINSFILLLFRVRPLDYYGHIDSFDISFKSKTNLHIMVQSQGEVLKLIEKQIEPPEFN
ncbi:hypothetical protein TNCV_538461 [Trichonephila clavipes]|nr:hypothetical protein TNCV_538461 [Trichonephila clavipes]